MLRVVEDEIGQEDEVEFPLLVVAFVQGLEQRIWRCSPGESLDAVHVKSQRAMSHRDDLED